MFNQTAFNQTAYNQPSGGLITVVVQLSSSSTTSARLICIVPVATHLDGVSSSTQRLVTVISAVLSAVSSLTCESGARVLASSAGSVAADCLLIMRGAASLGANNQFSPQVIRTTPISSTSDGFGDIDFNLVRAYIQSAFFSGFGELHALNKVITRFVLRFLGSVNPNDVVEIDMQHMTATINGQNALHLIDGRFWQLRAGRNTIKYTDSEITRQVALTITFRDRWL